MGWPGNGPLNESDEPWAEAPPASSRSKPRRLRSSEGMEDGENWGIPGLELTATLRPDGSGERSAEEERTLAEARRRVVNAILPEVLNRAEALRARIWQEYEKAVKEGRGAPSAERTERAVHLLGQARRLRDQLIQELGVQLSEHAARVEAEHIVRKSDRKPEILAPIVGEALAKGLKALAIGLRLHPRELKRLQDNALDLVIELEQCPDIDLRPDEWIKPGACLVETEAGAIEAHPDTRAERLAQILLGLSQSRA